MSAAGRHTLDLSPEWVYSIFHHHSCPRNKLDCLLYAFYHVSNQCNFIFIKVTRPTDGLQRPPVMQVIHLPLPVKTHPSSLARPVAGVPRSWEGQGCVRCFVSEQPETSSPFPQRPSAEMKGKFSLNGGETAFRLGIVGQCAGTSHSFPAEKVSARLLAHLTGGKPEAQGGRTGSPPSALALEAHALATSCCLCSSRSGPGSPLPPESLELSLSCFSEVP